MYAGGLGVPEDFAAAAAYYRRAAEAGIKAAQHNLGGLCREGKGVPQDWGEAIRWYTKAADQGVAEAQFNLCLIYVRGEGVAVDFDQAFEWCLRAANQHDETAKRLLPTITWQNLEMLRTRPDSLEPTTQFMIACGYYLGENVDLDYE